MRPLKTHSVTVALAIGAAAVALAACGGGEDGDNGSANAANPGAGSGIVSIESVDGTDVLVDSEGQTLYSAEVEDSGRIRCTGGCTSFWDPVAARAQESKTAAAELDLQLGAVKRPDGARQLTLEGRPLYRFTQEAPGQLDGDGFVDDFEGTHFEWAAATVGSGSPGARPDASSGKSPY